NYGAPSASFFANYYSLLGSTRGLRVGPNVRHLIGHLLDHRPVQRATLAILQRARERRATGRFHPEAGWIRDDVSQFFAETRGGRFYAERSPWPVLEKIEVPALLGTHWGNLPALIRDLRGLAPHSRRRQEAVHRPAVRVLAVGELPGGGGCL